MLLGVGDREYYCLGIGGIYCTRESCKMSNDYPLQQPSHFVQNRERKLCILERSFKSSTQGVVTCLCSLTCNVHCALLLMNYTRPGSLEFLYGGRGD